ncbi:excalibur calcium-binding domain-containing protein [Deinococcus sp. UYEF24]
MKKSVLFTLALPALLLSTTATALTPPRQPVPLGGFRNCAQALAYGYNYMRKGEPGYSKKLDRDGNGIACETKRK